MSYLLVRVVLGAIELCTVVIFVRVIVSWVAPTSRHPAVAFLCRYTDPILEPIRKRLPRAGPVDFSPMVAILVLIVVRNVLVQLLVRL